MPARESLIFKFETDSVSINEVLCAAIIEVESGILTQYPSPAAVFKAAGRLLKAELLISHSKFHCKVLEKIFGQPPCDYFDTQDAAAMLLPYERHRLQDWAGRYKIAYSPGRGNDIWTPALQRRCDAGARVIEHLYHDLIGSEVAI